VRGWLITKSGCELGEIDAAQLPPGDRTIEVRWSSLNYKDALAMTGSPGVVRSFPMVPGIDLAGDDCLVTGCGLGERHWGGYAELARVPEDFVVPIPAPFTPREAMAIGTAGFTAMQCVDALEKAGVKPGGRDVVVTGAAGGVGSIAIALLKAKGFRVVASTGRVEEAEYLQQLGAAEVIGRDVLSAESKRPMETERWAGAVDTVGGATLSGIIRTLQQNGAVAACGLAGGAKLETTVFPFILRGVSLLGVNSVEVPNAERRRIWALLAQHLNLDLLERMITQIPLDAVAETAPRVLAGQVRGRIVVKI